MDVKQSSDVSRSRSGLIPPSLPSGMVDFSLNTSFSERAAEVLPPASRPGGEDLSSRTCAGWLRYPAKAVDLICNLLGKGPAAEARAGAWSAWRRQDQFLRERTEVLPKLRDRIEELFSSGAQKSEGADHRAAEDAIRVFAELYALHRCMRAHLDDIEQRLQKTRHFSRRRYEQLRDELGIKPVILAAPPSEELRLAGRTINLGKIRMPAGEGTNDTPRFEQLLKRFDTLAEALRLRLGSVHGERQSSAQLIERMNMLSGDVAEKLTKLASYRAEETAAAWREAADTIAPALSKESADAVAQAASRPIEMIPRITEVLRNLETLTDGLAIALLYNQETQPAIERCLAIARADGLNLEWLTKEARYLLLDLRIEFDDFARNGCRERLQDLDAKLKEITELAKAAAALLEDGWKAAGQRSEQLIAQERAARAEIAASLRLAPEKLMDEHEPSCVEQVRLIRETKETLRAEINAGDVGKGEALHRKWRGQIEGLAQAIRDCRDGLDLSRTHPQKTLDGQASLEKLLEAARKAAEYCRARYAEAGIEKQTRRVLCDWKDFANREGSAVSQLIESGREALSQSRRHRQEALVNLEAGKIVAAAQAFRDALRATQLGEASANTVLQVRQLLDAIHEHNNLSLSACEQWRLSLDPAKLSAEAFVRQSTLTLLSDFVSTLELTRKLQDCTSPDPPAICPLLEKLCKMKKELEERLGSDRNLWQQAGEALRRADLERTGAEGAFRSYSNSWLDRFYIAGARREFESASKTLQEKADEYKKAHGEWDTLLEYAPKAQRVFEQIARKVRRIRGEQESVRRRRREEEARRRRRRSMGYY